MDGVEYELPVNNSVPPVKAEYHLIVAPEDGVAEIVTDPVLHREELLTVLIDGDVAMLAITDVLADVQALAVAST